MLGLIYRELKVYAKGKYHLPQMLLILLIEFIVELSCRVGNLKTLLSNEEYATLEPMLYASIVYMFGYILMMPVMTERSCVSDHECGFMRYSFTTALPAWKLALAKYIVKALKFLAGFGCAILSAFMYCKMVGRPFTSQIVGVITLIGIWELLYGVISTTLYHSAHTTRAWTVMYNSIGFSMVLVTSPIILIPFRDDFKQLIVHLFEGESSDAELMQILSITKDNIMTKAQGFIETTLRLSPIIIIGILAGGFAMSVWQLKRRGIRCEK